MKNCNVCLCVNSEEGEGCEQAPSIQVISGTPYSTG